MMKANGSELERAVLVRSINPLFIFQKREHADSTPFRADEDPTWTAGDAWT
jgi:hypothetical protein